MMGRRDVRVKPGMLFGVLWRLVLVFFFFAGCLGDPGQKEGVAASFFFNHPESFEFERAGRLIEETLVREIDSAQSSVSMAVFNFESPLIASALLRAKERGVVVRVTGDIDESDTQGYRSLAGLDLSLGNLYGIQHNKFIVIDAHTLVTGTGNLSPSGFARNNNHFIVIHDAKLAALYEAEFDQMYLGFFGSSKSPQNKRLAHNSPVSVYFSPQEGQEAVDELIQLVRSARHSVHYMIFAFTHDELASELIRAAQRGVKVRGIHDSHFVKGVSQEAPRFYRASFHNPNLSVRVEGNDNVLPGSSHGGKMHCKTLIIDAQTPQGVLATGSFNWSSNAVQNNDENLLIIRDEALAKSALVQWHEAWGYSNSLAPLFSGGSGAFGEPGEIIISEVGWAANFGAGPYSAPNEKDDFVEIYNRGERVIDLSHWALVWKRGAKEFAYPVPGEYNGAFAPVLIAPGEYRVFATGATGSSFGMALAPGSLIKISSTKDFFLTGNSLEVSLYDPQMKLIDTTGPFRGAPPGGVDWPRRQSYSMTRAEISAFPSGALAEPWWEISQEPCRNCEPTASLYATPGRRALQSNPPVFREATRHMPVSGEYRFEVETSGSACSDPLYYSVTGPGSPSLRSISRSPSGLVFSFTATPGAPDELYTIEASGIHSAGVRAFLDFSGARMVATSYGLFREIVPGADVPVVVIDPGEESFDLFSSGGLLYAATSGGLGVSSDGVNFSPLLQGFAVYDLEVSGSLIAAATARGLYLSYDSGASFAKIQSGVYDEVLITSFYIIAHRSGSYSGIYRFDRAAPAAVSPLPGFLPPYSLAHNGDEVMLLAGDSLYRSTGGGASFAPVAAVSGAKGSFERLFSLGGGEYLLSGPEDAMVVSGAGVVYHEIIAPAGSFRVHGATNRELVTPWGFYRFNGSAFLPVKLLPCDQTASGRVRINGLDVSGQAAVELSEIFWEQGDERAFIELEVKSSGRLGGLSLRSSSKGYHETLLDFPDLYVQAPGKILVYLGGSPAAGGGVAFAPGVVEFFITAPEPSKSDAVYSLYQNATLVDFVFYSNRNGNVLSSMMNGSLRDFYRLGYTFSFTGLPLLYPIDGYNDDYIEAGAVDISARRAGDSLQKSGGQWVLGSPSPGG